MTDIPGDSSTTVSVAVGGTVTNSLETTGDHDWIRLELTAGETVTISLSGTGTSPLSDPYLYFRDSAGNLLASNDDSSGLNSKLSFTATTTGTYYIDVGAYADSGTGTYEVRVDPYTPPPIYSYDQIADELPGGTAGGLPIAVDQLHADGNGAGAQVLFAHVTAGLALTNADFLIVG